MNREYKALQQKKAPRFIRQLFWCLLILPYFSPANYVFPSIVNRAFDALLVFSLIATLAMMVWSNFRFDSYYVLLILAYLWMTIATINNADECNIIAQLNGTIRVVGLFTLAQIGLRKRQREFLLSIILVGTVTVTLCAATMFYYKNRGGMNSAAVGLTTDWGKHYSADWYYLGHDTGSIFTIYPVIATAMVYELTFKGKVGAISNWNWAVTFLSCIYVRSMNAVGILLLLAALTIIASNAPKLVISRYITLGVNIGAFVFFVILQAQRLFEHFIVNILQKSLTLSNRQYIWERSLESISKYPLGRGTLNDFNFFGVLRTNHSHNMILELLFRGGYITLSFYIAFLLRISREIDNCKYQELRSILSILFFCYISMCVFDFYIFNPVPMILMALVANAGLFNNSIQDVTTTRDNSRIV